MCAGGAMLGIVGYRLLLGRAHASILAARDGRDTAVGDFRMPHRRHEGAEAQSRAARGLPGARAARDDRGPAPAEHLGHHAVQHRGCLESVRILRVWSALLLFVAPAFSILDCRCGHGLRVRGALHDGADLVDHCHVPTFMRGRVSLDKMRMLGDTLVGEQGVESHRSLWVRARRADPHRARSGSVYKYPAPPADGARFHPGPR